MKRGFSPTGYLLPRLQDVLFFALTFGVILLGPRLLNTDGDLGRHLTLGAYILDHRIIPSHDLFSHTMYGAPLTPHEWLAEILYTLAYRLMGLNGVVLLSALLIAGTFMLVYRETVHATQRRVLSFGLVFWAAAASSLHWIARPHLFTLLLLAFWTSRLSRLARGESVPLWQFPLIMLLWANLHGAFIAGVVVWGAYLVGHLCEQRKGDLSSPIMHKLLAVGALAFAATLLNPTGWHLWETSLGYVQNRYLVGHTQEYFSPDFHQLGAWPFLALLAFSLLILGRGHQRLSAADALLLAGWSAMGLYSARNIPLYAVVTPAIIASAAGASLEKAIFWQNLEERFQSIEQLLRGFLWPVVTLVLAVGLLFSSTILATRIQFDPDIFPLQAADWLKSHPQEGNMFNHFPWGGYLLYRLWPEQRVFIDGQTDFYGEALTRQYEQVITLSPGWEDVLAEYQVTWVIMPSNSLLAQALHDEAGWEVLYEDATAAILCQR